MTLDKWHGWSRAGTALHVGPLPGRKSIALYAIEGGVMHTLAYFSSEADAERAVEALDWIMGVQP